MKVTSQNPESGSVAAANLSAFVRRVQLSAVFAVLSIGAAFATDPPDWQATLTGARTDITTLLTTYGPLVVSLMVFVFGFRFIVRWIFRAMGGL